MISSDDFFGLRFLTDKLPSNGAELTGITSCLFGRRLLPDRGRRGLTRRQENKRRGGSEREDLRVELFGNVFCVLKKTNKKLCFVIVPV